VEAGHTVIAFYANTFFFVNCRF